MFTCYNVFCLEGEHPTYPTITYFVGDCFGEIKMPSQWNYGILQMLEELELEVLGNNRK